MPLSQSFEEKTNLKHHKSYAPDSPQEKDGAPTSFAVLDCENDDQKQPDATKQLTSELAATINLTKNLVGSGIFTLPLALSRASVTLGLAMMIFVCTLCAGSFILIAKNCKSLGCATYREMAMKSIGPRFTFFVDICIFVNGILGPLAYVILVCDFFQDSIPAVIGVHFARWQLVVLDTVALILPLSYIKDLSPLRIPSMIALLIIAFIFIYVVQDWLRDFRSSLKIFEDGALNCNLGVFFATSVYTGAFSAHYNAPTFYRELGQDLAAHTRVVRQSFASAFMMYALFAIAGYGKWGGKVEGNLLKNYGEDGGAAIELATLAMGFSITLSFPLVFNSGRAAFYGVFPAIERAREANPDKVHLAVTTVLVLGICSTACIVKDVQVVVGLAGALLQTPICFTIPGIVYWKIARSEPTLPLQGREPITSSKFLMFFSILLMAFGLQNQIVGSLVVLDIL